jgi:clan AA aspartic protease (TIGR02281 family)
MNLRFHGLLVVATALVVRADILQLKNGHRMEGIIHSETATEYQLDIGFGTVAVPKAQVAGVERASAAAHKQLEQERQRKYILHEDYAPPGQQDLAQALQALEDQRVAALQARRRIVELQHALTRATQELQQLQEQERQVASRVQLPAQPTREAVDQYNCAVAELNALRARMLVLTATPREKADAMDQSRRTIAQYTTALFTFTHRVKQRQPHGSGTDTPPLVADFFAELHARLMAYQGEIKQVRLPYQADKRQVVVKARLNGQVEGRFIVDTGATTMTITEELARRLHLPPSPHEAQVALADGSTRKTRSVILRSVEVEDARVENVVAVIMPAHPAAGIEGLLGMSFLMEFNVQLDPVAQTLTLNRFAPR